MGENRDQEAAAKRIEVGDAPLRWHMIGQLQRNKVRSVVRWADVVESVDRPDLAHRIGRAAADAGRVVEVLIQVSLDTPPEPGRGGVDPADVATLATAILEEPGLRLGGVMGVAPHPGDPRPAFELLARIHEQVRAIAPEAVTMSAGMSGDLEAAIAAGATQVRIGGAILGNRPPLG